jgi:hypothetical protein
MLKSGDGSSTTPAQSYSTTKDDEVKIDQNTASMSKAVGAVKDIESPDDGLEKEDANEIPGSASEKQEHDEGDQDSGKGSNVDTRWERMFTRLLAFKEKHGDCVVPNRYSDDTQLGSWGKKKLPRVCILDVVVLVLVLVISTVDFDQTYQLNYLPLSLNLSFHAKTAL